MSRPRYDDLFGVNDEWSFGYQRSMDRSPLFLTGGRPFSNTLTGSFSVPYGYWTFGTDGSWSNYRSSIEGQLSTIDTSGGSRSLAPYVSRVLHRDRESKTWATLRLTWKETNNFILDSRIDVSSRILSIATAELGHSRRLAGGELTASLAFHRGVGILGAFNDATAAVGSPKGQFSKETATLGYSLPFGFGPVSVFYSGQISGQWSDDPLFGSEQMSLGGYSSVRGSREGVFYASRAAFLRNELAFPLPVPGQSEIASMVGRIEPYVGLDLGRTLAKVADGSLGGNLIGGAIGLRNRGGRVGLDISYADYLAHSGFSNGSRPTTGLVQARLSIGF